MIEPGHRIRFGPPSKDYRVVGVHVLLRPSIPHRVDEIWLAPDPHGRVILVAAEADEVEGGLNGQHSPDESATKRPYA